MATNSPSAMDENSPYVPEGFFKKIQLDENSPYVPEGFVKKGLAAPMEPTGFLESITGGDRMTVDMRNLAPIADSPEFNSFNGRSFGASLGRMLTNDDVELRNIMKEQFGSDISFRRDEKGNTVAILPSGEYALNKPGFSMGDVPGAALDAIAFGGAGGLAQGGKTLLTRSGKQALAATTVGGLKEGGKLWKGDNFEPVNVALDAGFGAGGQLVGEGVGALFQGFKGKLNALRDAKAAPARPPKLMGEGTPEEVIAAGAQHDIPVLTTDAMPPKNFITKGIQNISDKFAVLGTGGTRTAQQQARVDAVEKVADTYADYSDEAIINSLKSQRDTVKRDAGSVLGGIQNKVDETLAARAGIKSIMPDGLPGGGQRSGMVQEVLTERTAKSISDVMAELADPRILQDPASTGKLKELLTAIAQPGQTFSKMRQNRTAFREMVEAVDPMGRSQFGSNTKRLFTKVDKALTRDLENAVRITTGKKGLQRWQKANKDYGELAVGMQKSGLKQILDKGDITPEIYKKMMLSKDQSSLTRLYKGLTPEGQTNLRSSFITSLVDKLEGQANGMTPDAFATHLRKYGKQVGTFFEGDERKALTGLFKVLQATRPAQSASLTTPTGQSLLLPAIAYGSITKPLTATALSGLLLSNKLYNSPAIRDRLIALGKKPSKEAVSDFLVFANNLVGQSVQGNTLQGDVTVPKQAPPPAPAQ